MPLKNVFLSLDSLTDLQVGGVFFEATSHQVYVAAKAIFLEEQSSPVDHHYVWAYHIKIRNLNDHSIQLRARTWYIVASTGFVQKVHGSGVVGELPILKPDCVFEYTSGTSLSSPSGMMHGFFHMLGRDDVLFDVAIPSFSLDSPHQPVTYS